MRLIISIVIVDSLAGAVVDPCTALHERSFCMEDGYCYGLLSEVDSEDLVSAKNPLRCHEAYTDARFSAMTLREDPPIIKPVNSREWTQINKCESEEFDMGSIFPLLENPDHAGLFDHMLQTLTNLHDRLRKMYPYILYDPVVDAETLRQFVQGSRDISTQVFGPLIREGDREIVEAFQCAIVRSDFGKSLRAYLDLYSREIVTSNEPGVPATILTNLAPFVHAWLTVNAFLGINLPLWRSQDLGLITTISRLDPLYLESDEGKGWIVPIAEPTLKSPHGSTHLVLPALMLPEDEFPLTVLDTLSLPEEGIADAGNHLADSLLLFLSDHQAIAYEYLRASMFFLRHHDSIVENDLENFCTKIQPVVIRILDDIIQGERNSQNLFGTFGISEFLNLCGSSGFTFDQRVSHLLPLFLGERSRAGAALYRFDTGAAPSEKDTFPVLRALKFISDLPIHALQQAVVIVPTVKTTDLLGRRSARKRTADDSGATFRDIASYHSWLSRVARGTIPALFGGSSALVRFAHPAESQMTELLRAFGRVVALLFVEGDPENVISSYLASRPDTDIYFNSISVRKGFCEVLPCNLFDHLIGRDDVRSALEVIRGVELLTRSFAATEIDPSRRVRRTVLAIQND